MKVLSRLLCLPLPLPLPLPLLVMGQVEVNNFIGQANNEWIFTGTDGKTSRIISVDFEPKSIGSVYLLTAHTSEVNILQTLLTVTVGSVWIRINLMASIYNFQLSLKS